jgi:hypothetical protein
MTMTDKTYGLPKQEIPENTESLSATVVTDLAQGFLSSHNRFSLFSSCFSLTVNCSYPVVILVIYQAIAIGIEVASGWDA